MSALMIPIKSPPRAAPSMFPIPPSTAAVKAIRPVVNPRSKRIELK